MNVFFGSFYLAFLAIFLFYAFNVLTIVELDILYDFLPARRRRTGLVVSGVCLCVCVCAHCFCPQDISRTGSWITTKFGGWEEGVNL